MSAPQRGLENEHRGDFDALEEVWPCFGGRSEDRRELRSGWISTWLDVGVAPEKDPVVPIHESSSE